MASTNSTSKSSLNLSKKADKLNLYTSDATYLTTGNQKSKNFTNIMNNTYTLGVTDKKEVNAYLLSYDDGIKKKGSEIVGAEGLDADESYTIYGQPDKWVYDYAQKYDNCGVVSSLNVLSMAGVKDIQSMTTDYETWLKTGKVTTKSYTINGQVQTVTKTAYPKPLFKYETEELFTLWAIQNSKNDDELYARMYEQIASKGGNTLEMNNYWSNIDNSYCIHSNNYSHYNSVNKINSEDGGTAAYMQKNILKAFGIESTLVEERIKVLNDLKDALIQESKTENTTNTLNNLDTGTVDSSGNAIYNDGTWTEVKRSTEITDNRSSVETIEKTVVTKYYKKTITVTEQQEVTKLDALGNPVLDSEGNEVKETKDVQVNKQIDVITSIETTTITTTVNRNEYTTEIKKEHETQTATKTPDEINSADEIANQEFTSDKSTTTTTTYVSNSEKYTFAKTLAEAVKDGKGIIIGGNARGLTGDSKGEYAGHAITVTGVMYGNVLTSTIDSKEFYTEDVVGFYVIDTGGWLTKTESAQFVTLEKLYDFLMDFKRNDATTSDIYLKSINPYVITDEAIRKWADNLNLVGTSKKNVLVGNSGNNRIYGGRGDDFLYGEDGNDFLYGEDDNDTLYGGSGNDYIDCGRGNDTVVIAEEDIVKMDVKRNKSTTISKDYVLDDDRNYIIKGNQIDTVVAKYGRNTLQFEDIDIDSFTFGQSNNNLIINYSKTKSGIALASSLIIKDYFKNSSSSIKYLVDAKTHSWKTDTKPNEFYMNTYDFVKKFLENANILCTTSTASAAKLNGTQYADTIIGGNYNDTIKGLSGNDTLYGGNGNDTIYGGDGNDIIYGSYGNDKIYGERGNNIIKYEETFSINNNTYTGFGGNDFIYSGRGQDFIEMTSKSFSDLKFTKSGNNLVIYYTDKGDSITIQNYFRLRGNTSVKNIKLSDMTFDLVNGYTTVNNNLIASINNKSQRGSIVGSDGYDILYASNYGDTIDGGLGNDIIYGGRGDDNITGGYGDDRMYGNGGNDTFYFNYIANGYDTISTSGSGTITLVFADTNLNFNEYGVKDGISNNIELYDGTDSNFSYTKSGNDLIINYAKSLENSASATLKIAGFFKSKNNFILKDANGNSLNLKTDIYVYMRANATKATKITGTNFNDYIQGGSGNDRINGGRGDDIIIGGRGNDTITGGIGHNTVIYNKDDGNDTIVLSKNEKLDIKMQGFDSGKDISFRTSGKNLLIYYKNSNGGTSYISLKNFISRDTTGANGSVKLYVNGTFYKDLKADNILPTYSNFTARKYSYTGTWLSDTIDASKLSGVRNNRGATINGGNGNDIIIGSRYNDTIKGGNGNDTIYGGYGTNKIDGGNGNDTYHIFADDYSATLQENTIIKDTGRLDNDTAIIYETKDNISVWFNISRNGNANYTFNITKTDSNGMENGRATLTGVENVILNGKTKDDTSDDVSYDYGNSDLLQRVKDFLNDHNFADVNYVMTKTFGEEKKELLAIFNDNNYWKNV